MNHQRAKEIAQSPVMAGVTYQGVPVYIQHVDEENETARIYPIYEPENELEVSLNMLVEE
ncbi:small, acid-soluble spore protein H [Paenibacillus sp. J31TS4]|uniref:H-type small acid-soluble spore protein n=1 Tax=Paenibacillus sp. J31TS4 TaxID=2807195 RepID=UPI001AFFDFA1|nr:H-type small acid-soluble spore protein [Paenibacillus sp. J31TS4]GIP38473.1 small, acid-soluble spore protein H [Paenibacillus sp. J31TS4]